VKETTKQPESVERCAEAPFAARNGSAIPATAIKTMCEAWTEMNTIRARDGVPYMHNGYKSDVTQEYWDDIMQRLDDEVKAATGRGCWLHPALYSPNIVLGDNPSA